MSVGVLKIGANSCGGSSYLYRIFKAAVGHDEVLVIVKYGCYAKTVMAEIVRELVILNKITVLQFSITVVLVADDG